MMLLNDLAYLLETENGSVTRATNLFAGQLPVEPVSCAALMDYEGMDLLARQNDSEQETERPRVQLVVRAATYAGARDLCWSLWKSLARIVNREVNGTWYQRVMPLQSPFLMDHDESNRVLFACNFEVTKEVE
jgi:hypothetical protein